jgi:hypothetical protein
MQMTMRNGVTVLDNVEIYNCSRANIDIAALNFL